MTLPSPPVREAVAAVGTFDGVHLGHAAVLREVVSIAAAEHREPVAFTFDRHPLQLIDPSRAPEAITALSKKLELMANAGVRPIVLEFDETLRSTTAAGWLSSLSRDYNVRSLVAGYDNTFGSDGVALSLSDYKRIGKAEGIEVSVAPVVEGISSSAIRRAIKAGDVGKAREMLGRRFLLPGNVVEGNKLGRTIGFPTANLQPDPEIILPADGVYAAFAILPSGERILSVVNIGIRPTIRRGNNRTVEAHLIDWSGDLYGQQLKLAFQTRLRNEITFNSIDLLSRQIEKDIADAVVKSRH